MAEPTLTDTFNAQKYAEQRGKLMLINVLHKKYPHIFSHCDVEITKASQDDYYYPPTFDSKAIMVDIKLNADVFEQLNCYPWTKRGPCKPDSKAEYVRIGDTEELRIACAPACFNLKEETQYQDDEPIPHVPQLELVDNEVKIASQTSLWMELPIVRSGDRYSARLNDFTEGFNKQTDVNKLFGFKYTINNDYCQMFGQTLETDKTGEPNCTEPWWMFFLDAIIGKQFLLTITEAITDVTGGNPLRPDDKPPPDIDEEYYSVKAWQQRINTNFTPPDVDIESPKYEKRLTSQRELIRRELYQTLKYSKDIDLDLRRRLDSIDYFDVGPKKLSSMDYAEIASMIAALGLGIGISENLTEFLWNLVSDPKTYAGFSDTIFFNLVTKVTEKLGKRFMDLAAETSAKIGGNLAKRVLENTTMIMVRRSVTSLAFKTIGKTLLTVAKTLAKIESVVGIVFLLTTLFDLIFSFWDPFGFNQQFPPGYLETIQKNFDFAHLQNLATSDPVLDIEMLAGLLLTEDEYNDIVINEFVYIYDYLNNLIVNSEGSRIDRGDEIEINDDNVEQNNDQLKADVTKIYTQKELFLYENDHYIRLKNLKIYNYFGVALVSLGFVFCFAQMTIVCLLLILFGIMITSLSYFLATSDYVFDVDLSNAGLDSLNRNKESLMY